MTYDDLKGTPVVIAVIDDQDVRYVTETGLTGWFDVENGQFVIPFKSAENAEDCLRLVAQSVRQEAGADDV